MFRKKKTPLPNPPVDLNALIQSQLGGSVGFASGTAPQVGPISSAFNSLIAQSKAQMLVGLEEKPNPEPKGEPKTVVGLTGYRLYTLDNELYLRGQQGKRQKGRESEQAKHNGRSDPLLSDAEGPVSHPAPAWDCLCGFAAFFWPTSLGEPAWRGVLAEVQAGGRTIYCVEGWRAERIALSKLWIACPIFPDAALETLRERYEVPVEVL